MQGSLKIAGERMTTNRKSPTRRRWLGGAAAIAMIALPAVCGAADAAGPSPSAQLTSLNKQLELNRSSLKQSLATSGIADNQKQRAYSLVNHFVESYTRFAQ